MQENQLEDWRNRALTYEKELNGTVIGLAPAIRALAIAIFARGHVLLEGNAVSYTHLDVYKRQDVKC